MCGCIVDMKACETSRKKAQCHPVDFTEISCTSKAIDKWICEYREKAVNINIQK